MIPNDPVMLLSYVKYAAERLYPVWMLFVRIRVLEKKNWWSKMKSIEYVYEVESKSVCVIREAIPSKKK